MDLFSTLVIYALSAVAVSVMLLSMEYIMDSSYVVTSAVCGSFYYSSIILVVILGALFVFIPCGPVLLFVGFLSWIIPVILGVAVSLSISSLISLSPQSQKVNLSLNFPGLIYMLSLL